MSTLVREDLFAGYLANDMERFEKGVASLARLEREHPDKPGVKAWQGSAEIFRAVIAHEKGDAAGFLAHYQKGGQLCRESGFPETKHLGVLIVCGATHLVFADRMPESHRAESWKIARDGYVRTSVIQSDTYKKLPLHLKGELLVGLAQSLQRTGDDAGMKRYLAEIVTDMPNTVYAARAQRWIDRPEVAAKTSLTCLTCHDPGRLKNRMAEAAKP